jgi:hypothetical protein
VNDQFRARCVFRQVDRNGLFRLGLHLQSSCVQPMKPQSLQRTVRPGPKLLLLSSISPALQIGQRYRWVMCLPSID